MTTGGLTALAMLHVFTHELLLIVAVGIAASSLDDFALDLVYLGRRAWRKGVVYRRHRRLRAEELPRGELGWIAIIVPAWDEAAVIGAMLRDLTARLDYPHYRVFAGVYPNDPASAAAVAAVGDPRITTAVCSRFGPTTKADCLNHLWRAVLADELAAGRRFKAIVLRDSAKVAQARRAGVPRPLEPTPALAVADERGRSRDHLRGAAFDRVPAR